MQFVKLNANGNSFIVLDHRKPQFPDAQLSGMANQLCRQGKGLGAEGVLVAEASEHADLRMRLFNRDGSEVGIGGGNETLCFARYAFENALSRSPIFLETSMGTVKAGVKGQTVSIHLPGIGFSPDQLDIEGNCLRMSSLDLGIPHCVVTFDAGERLPSRERLRELGRVIRNDLKRFPDGVNVNFLRKVSEKRIEVITFERGVEDLTDSCGSGSIASAIVSRFILGTGEDVLVANPGGTLHLSLRFDKPGGKVHASLTGETTLVASGTLSREWLGDTFS